VSGLLIDGGWCCQVGHVDGPVALASKNGSAGQRR
jgi:hypothetical protein